MSSVKWVAAFAVVLLLMAGSGAVAWRWQANSYAAKLTSQESTHQADLTAIANAGATQSRQALEKQQTAEQALAYLDSKTTMEKANALAENETLRRAVADGARRLRLRIAGSCRAGGSNVPGTASAARLGNAGDIELSAAAGRTVFDFRTGVIADQSALIALQACVRDVCSK
ncbi:lysis system i-spanin subunit Rz [Pseudomonas akapageensis]|uniref:lysis system i-spanin subunit Rz n=1 Tax=Pseudomonas akapageensis TaxID=2609961 RepID=UPI001C49C01C|nr:lysis system i-spanin subunit Rz [Pseudomonas akapageensis]